MTDREHRIDTGSPEIPEDLLRLHERATDCEMAHVDMIIHPQPVREIIERIARNEAALRAVNNLRNIRNGMADLFHVVVREENGKQVCIGDLIDAALETN